MDAFIIFCSCCCTPLDVEAASTGVTHLELVCINCETEFTIEFDPEKMAHHGMFG